MFDLGKFIYNAKNGLPVDVDGFKEHVNSFETVIMWGAGNLGTAVGCEMLKRGFNISYYWDAQAESKGIVNGLEVIQPFSRDVNKEETLVIFCISNVITGTRIWKQLSLNNFKHTIKGIYLCNALLCPLLYNSEFDGSVCAKTEMCGVCDCKIIDFLLKKQLPVKSIPPLYLKYANFLIGTTCNLRCKYCFQYLGSYPSEKMYNVSTEQIFRDIDRFMDIVDGIGTIVIVGGETFLHNDIGKIVAKLSEKDNFGVLIVDSNGTVKIKPEQLELFTDKRIRLTFSNYIGSISPAQEEIMRDNIELAKSMGIMVTVQNSLPTWNIPGTFDKKNYTEEYLKTMRKDCKNLANWVYDGKLFVCSYTITVHNLIEEREKDFIDIHQTSDHADLRLKIADYLDQPYLPSCLYCDNNSAALTDKAGEQGFDERYSIERYV